jgi:hypothetical protein
MIRRGGLCLLLCFAFLVHALDINLKGTIRKDDGTPVAGVKVTTTVFKKSKFSDLVSDTTNSQGNFEIMAVVVSTKNSMMPSASLFQFLIKSNIIVFSPSLGSVSGQVDIYSANGKRYASIPFKDLSAGKQGIMLPRLMPGINFMRLAINGNTFSQTLLSMGNGVYSQNGLSAIKTTDISLLGKKTAVLDTLIVTKKEFIDSKIPLDTYNKQNIVDTISEGVLRKLFQISNTMIAGWKMRYSTLDSSFTLWSAGDLYLDIDGGFERYTDWGMLQAADIFMLGPIVDTTFDTTSDKKIDTTINRNILDVHSFIMDFGKETNAKTMYATQKSQYFESLVPGYDSSVACVKEALGGVTAYAYFKQFYFELIFIGFPEKDKALAATKTFLDYFKSKAQ